MIVTIFTDLIVRECLPERDYITFGSLLSQIRLSSVVCNVRAPYLGFETFGNISSPYFTLAIL